MFREADPQLIGEDVEAEGVTHGPKVLPLGWPWGGVVPGQVLRADATPVPWALPPCSPSASCRRCSLPE